MNFMKKKPIYEQLRPKDLYDLIIRQRRIDGENFSRKYKKDFVETKCPACNGKGEYAFDKYRFSHRICQKCKTLFCSPRPSEELLSIYYNSFDAPRIWTKLLVSTNARRKMLQYQPRVNRIISLIKSKTKRPLSLAIDIGAGSGAFALCLQKSGFVKKVRAIDLSEYCVKNCLKYGLDAKVGSISDVEENSADLICMNDLIEHLFDPKSFLKDCWKALKKGGFISIATPNGEGLDFKILKDRTKNISPPEHLNYFNTVSLGTALRSAGFSVVSIDTPGILDVNILCNEKAAGLQIKKNNEYIDHILSQNESVLANFQTFIAENKLSSHMVALAKK